VPQWYLNFGAAYAYDPVGFRAPKTKVVTKTITREISRGPVVGKVRGIVRDQTTKKPIGGATVRYLNRRENPQVTADDGTFTSYGFTPGLVVLEVSRDDYNPMRVETNAVASGETPIEALLTAKPPQAGTLRGKVTDDAGLPVAANVRLTPAAGGNAVDADLEGPGVFNAKLPGGDYAMEVTAQNYLSKQKQISVTAGQVQSVDVVVHKKPATSHVALTKTEIAIKGTIHFGTNNAEIKPDGEQLLDEVVDVMVKNPQLRKIRVEGHTDNRGNPELNLALSKARAAAVVQYLVKQGIDPSRLESEGYGATQPLVPNLTPANRAKNRRVTFRILDGGESGPL
jgi:OmpA-OmpF porin, OOP family